MKILKAMGLTLSVFGLLVGNAERAEAVPVTFGANAYEYVVANSITWSAADAAASGSVFMGTNGHLATITSQAENDFMIGLVTSNPSVFAGAWLGGNYTEWLRGPEAGSSLAYTNWNTAEPNNNGIMYMSVGLTTPNSGAAGLGKWLDDSGVQGVPSSADPVVGYFIEYEGVSAVPIPAALPLFGTGLAILGFVGWRRKRQVAPAV